MVVEVGRSEISPSFDSILKLMFARGEQLAFAADTSKTRYMLDLLATKFPLLKVLQIKEGLFMMGLKDDIFYLSWFITYFIQFGVSSGIITACTMNSLFLYSDKSFVFIYFFLFGSSAVMLSFFISTFFSRAKAAAAIGTLSFLGAFFPCYTVNDSAVPMLWKVMAYFLSPAFALGTVNFADYECAHVGVRWTNMWQASSGVNFLVCLVMMMVGTLLYCLLTLYFDKMAARVYKDESELEGYIRSDLYGTNDYTRNLANPIILGAIVFHAQGPQLFDYSIRLNHTWAFSGFPDVHTIMDVNGPYLNGLELGFTIVPTLQYGLSGFLTLQQMVDSLVILLSLQSGNVVGHGSGEITLPHLLDRQASVQLHSGYFIPADIRIAPFPTREYTDDNFQSIVKRVKGVLYLLGFLYPVSCLITYTVSEKELKIKEGLFMMGLKDDIFYLSWFIAYFIQFGVSSGIITACTMKSLFLYSDKSLVFIYSFLFGSTAIMLSFFISTFFSRGKAAAAIGTLSFRGAFVPYYTVNDSAVPMLWKVMASFLSPTAFALGTSNCVPPKMQQKSNI